MDSLMYEKIARHIGHKIEVATYGNGWGDIVNVAVECMDCHEVIVDAENPEWAWEDKPVKWQASKKHPYGVERA